MKCVVLGGTGFIGSHLVNALVEQGHDVASLTRHLPLQNTILTEAAVTKVKWQVGDYQNREDIKRLLEGNEVCFHLISSSLPSSSNKDPSWDVSTNVCSSLHVMEEAVAAGIQEMFFISSGGTIYGEANTLPIPESHSLEPTCSYGVTKLAIEKYLALFERLYGLQYKIVRLANPYGPGQDVNKAQGAVSVFIERNRNQLPIEIWGDGSIVRDYIYIDDAIQGVLALAEYKGSERIFNIGSGRGTSLLELLEEISLCIPQASTVKYLAPRQFDIQYNVLDITKARDLLAFAPKTSLREGISKTVEWQNLRNLTKISGN